jgi:hypothetical protein
LLLFSLLLLSALLADSVTWCAVGMLGCVMCDDGRFVNCW